MIIPILVFFVCVYLLWLIAGFNDRRETQPFLYAFVYTIYTFVCLSLCIGILWSICAFLGSLAP
jgi:hypothetical protein